MKRFIEVHKGEVMAGQGEVVLKSETDSACLVIAAYDAIRKIGGLAHASFFSSGAEHKWHSEVVRDAAHAIDEMIQDMTLLGSDKENIEVELVAGENVRCKTTDPAYAQNIATAINLLREKHIRYRENPDEEVGNHHVALDVESGKILFK